MNAECKVQNARLRVQGVECRGAKYRVHGADCSMYCAGFRVQDSCRVPDAGCRMQCRVQRGAIRWVQSAGRMLQDAGRMQYQGAVCRVQDTCRLQGAAESGVQGPEWRVRSGGWRVEAAECRMPRDGIQGQKWRVRSAEDEVEGAECRG